jgi:hypothetical protein
MQQQTLQDGSYEIYWLLSEATILAFQAFPFLAAGSKE